MKGLFEPMYHEESLGKLFKELLFNNDYLTVRMMLEDIYSDYKDVDGNFIEQFQTNAFNARMLELYFFAYFKSENYQMNRDYQYPDFLIHKDKTKVAIEITTANGEYNKEGGVTINSGEGMYSARDKKEYEEYLKNEVPLKFTSPIFSKLKKKYWEKPHCKDLPFAIAVEGFFEEGSLSYTSNPLTEILYGIRYIKDSQGGFYPQKIDKHYKGDTPILSGLFFKPTEEWSEMDNVSAILFQNSATISKFRRLGWYKGYYNSLSIITRRGILYNREKGATVPKYLAYELSQAPFKETWGNGLVVLHNPNAKYPIPKGYFRDAMDIWYENGEIHNSLNGGMYHFLNSDTNAVSYQLLVSENPEIKNITKCEFDTLNPRYKTNKNYIPIYWYKAEKRKAIAVLSSISTGHKSINSSGYGYEIFTTIEGAKSYKLHKQSNFRVGEIDDVSMEMFNEILLLL